MFYVEQFPHTVVVDDCSKHQCPYSLETLIQRNYVAQIASQIVVVSYFLFQCISLHPKVVIHFLVHRYRGDASVVVGCVVVVAAAVVVAAVAVVVAAVVFVVAAAVVVDVVVAVASVVFEVLFFVHVVVAKIPR